jgi:DNA-binding transcriptional MerR regulator
MNSKVKNAYKTIGEVTKELGLVNKHNGNLQTHTIRYWETQFKQIKPSIRAGKRRYYSEKNVKIIKYIKFLLKDRGLTIYGVKKLLNKSETDYLDDDVNIGINTSNKKNASVIKNKIKKISSIINELKKLK